MIHNDGQAFIYPQGDIRAHIVMDNLIYRREIPVMIGVFINPGRRPDQPKPTPINWGDRDSAPTPSGGLTANSRVKEGQEHALILAVRSSSGR
jgi:hypothetical protein